MATPVPLCVIGGGSIGMRHIGCAQASPNVDLTCVVEADPIGRARLTAADLPVVHTLDDVPTRTCAAIIATPTPDHLSTGLACLDRGWAVMVEKPVTETLAEADRLCAHAAAKALPLFTGYHRRCHPFVAQARERLTDLGSLVAVQGIWALRKHDSYYDLPWRRSEGAGPILTNLSHEIDLLHCLIGPITEVSAMTANAARGFDIEDTTALSLRFESGALGGFVMSDAGASPWAFEAATGENPAIAVRGADPLRLIGTAGSMGVPSLETWSATPGATPDWQHPLHHQPGPDLPKVDGIAAQLDRFAAAANGGQDEILATGLDGRQTMAVLDAIKAAAQSGQTQTVAP